MEVIWGKETLKMKCLNEKRANKENVNDESFRKTLTPRKIKLVEGITENCSSQFIYLTRHKILIFSKSFQSIMLII